MAKSIFTQAADAKNKVDRMRQAQESAVLDLEVKHQARINDFILALPDDVRAVFDKLDGEEGEA